MTCGLWCPFPLRASHSCISKSQLTLGQAQGPQLGARVGEVALVGIGKGCTSVKLEACQVAGPLRPRHSSPAQRAFPQPPCFSHRLPSAKPYLVAPTSLSPGHSCLFLL